MLCLRCKNILHFSYGTKVERLRKHFGLDNEGNKVFKSKCNPSRSTDSKKVDLLISNNTNMRLNRPKGEKPMLSNDMTDDVSLDSNDDYLKATSSVHSLSPTNAASHLSQIISTTSSTVLCQPIMKERAKKRVNAINWDDYFMSVAFLSAMRSKDPSTQVGACIVNEEKKIVGIGYNGFPRGCSDDELPWDRTGDSELETKYPYVCHAELNAILNKNSADVKGCYMYVALFPCNECAKVIIQSDIKEVVYMSDKYAATNSMKASRRMMEMAKVKLRHYVPSTQCITIDFCTIDSSLYPNGVSATSSSRTVNSCPDGGLYSEDKR